MYFKTSLAMSMFLLSVAGERVELFFVLPSGRLCCMSSQLGSATKRHSRINLHHIFLNVDSMMDISLVKLRPRSLMTRTSTHGTREVVAGNKIHSEVVRKITF